MNVQPQKILGYGKEGLLLLRTGRRIFSLGKQVFLFQRKKGHKEPMKKQAKKNLRQARVQELHWALGKFLQRAALMRALVAAVVYRYF